MRKEKRMGRQIINPIRQEKKQLMKSLGIKSGKKFRKHLKKARRSENKKGE